jgi:hypothetical protein
MNPLQHHGACYCLIAGLAAGFVGCSRNPTGAVDADAPAANSHGHVHQRGDGEPHQHGSGESHHHDHDEFHQHDHYVPAHKPHTFAEGVASLREHHEQIIAGKAGDTESPERVLNILIDLARWLPELAADSDMPEGRWNRVNAASGTLRAAYLAVEGRESSSQLKELSGLVGELEGLVPLATADGMPLPGDHDVQESTPAGKEG